MTLTCPIPHPAQKVFTGQKTRGLTRASRFRNMAFDTYEALCDDIRQYRQNLQQLSSERENIAAEIQHFYHKHDLGVMMDFLRGLDPGSYHAGSMEGGLVPLAGASLDQKMKVQPPPPVDEVLPVLPPIIPLASLKASFKNIVKRAFIAQGCPDLKEIVRP